MRVAVIGAGIAGLVAARDLAVAGHGVLVVEKSRGLGGRMGTRRVDGAVVDHGLPVLVTEFAPDTVHLDGDAVAWPGGMTTLPKAMAVSLEILGDTRVAALRQGSDGIEVAHDQGNTIGVFDAVIITAPAPQMVELLEHSPEPMRADAMRTISYDPAVMVLAGVRTATPGWRLARPDAGPIEYVTDETLKGRPAVDGVVPMVVRLRPDDSTRLFDASDGAVLAEVLPALATALGPGAPAPEWTQVKRWRYCIARSRVDQASVNPVGSPIILAGDAVAAGPTMDDVARTGEWAARRLTGDSLL